MITAVLDHLWQSTLFAGAAGLVTLLLRRNGARVRFWLWFAASVKFLAPFAALAALGAWLLPQATAPLPVLVDFAPVATPYVMPAAGAHMVAVSAPVWNWNAILLGVWVIGTIVITLHWLSRWRGLRAALSGAGPVMVIDGVAVRSAPAPLEPGLFGIFRPIILLPQGIEDRLSRAELDAVLAHEACHLRQRDNLWAAIHMVVEALFWFHPLVWWLGARLNDERERACDEAVLAQGQSPQVYAESILKVCKLYVQSPLACVSGISGAGLKERIERIVVENVVLPLSAARKLLLASLAAVSLIVPLSASLVMVARAVQAQTPPEPVVTPEHIAELRAEQAMPRTAVAFDPRNFDKFVGEYQLGTSSIFWITRDGSHYLSRLTGQTAIEVFPESQAKFFSSEVRAQISFDSDASGKVTDLVLHQGGLEQRAPRVSLDTAKAAEAALLARVKANKLTPAIEAAIRHQIDAIQKTGTYDYAAMTPELAAVARSQEAMAGQMFSRLGAFQSIAFKNVGPGGGDNYDVTFEHGHLTWSMGQLSADGKIRGMLERPVMQ